MKEALTAHTDVAARAESQELSVTRLGDLLGNSTLQINVNRDVAMLFPSLNVSESFLLLAHTREVLFRRP